MIPGNGRELNEKLLFELIRYLKNKVKLDISFINR